MIFSSSVSFPKDYNSPIPIPAHGQHLEIKRRQCNRHEDCDESAAKLEKSYFELEHCHDDCCEDCFGY